MATPLQEIAESFDRRASSYGRGNWHRQSAERLIEICVPRPGDRVLDAGTGTGFAAFAAARAVGARGRVIGVDVSSGMLREARTSLAESGLTNVEFIQADATSLDHDLFATGTFDVITSATGLLYMDPAEALHEWRRLLTVTGTVAFSTIAAGSPPGGRLFRECAAEFGVALKDPCEPLGTRDASRAALEEAGFDVVAIVEEVITFSQADLGNAWESNLRSPAFIEIRRLSPEALAALERRYLDALAEKESREPGALARADILYAV